MVDERKKDPFIQRQTGTDFRKRKPLISKEAEGRKVREERVNRFTQGGGVGGRRCRIILS